VWLGETDRLSDGTRRLYRQDVNQFCSWLAREGYIRSNPVDRTPRLPKPRRVPRALSAAQVAALLEVVPDLRGLVVVHLMLDLGMRAMEVANARVSDWDPAGATLLVRGKAGHERLLPVLESTTTVLERYFAERPVAGGALVSSYARPGGHLTPLYVSTMVAWWAKAAGIKHHAHDGVGGHALRHTCASDVLAHSGDLQAVCEMLGHSDLAVTSIYLRRVAAARLREAMEGRSYGPTMLAA